jgi:hypothetical protein
MAIIAIKRVIFAVLESVDYVDARRFFTLKCKQLFSLNMCEPDSMIIIIESGSQLTDYAPRPLLRGLRLSDVTRGVLE